MKIIFISDIHYETWLNNGKIRGDIKERLAKTISYGFLDIKGGNDSDVNIVFGGDFFSLYSLSEITELLERNEKGDNISGEKYYKEVSMVVNEIKEAIHSFLQEKMGDYNIKNIILSSGNHDYWATDYDSLIDINELPKIALGFLGIVVESSFGLKPIIQTSFSQFFQLTDKCIIVSSPLFSPLRTYPYMHEGRERFMEDLFIHESDNNYWYNLSKECKNWLNTKSVIHEYETFQGFSNEIASKLKDENNIMLYYNNPNKKRDSLSNYYEYFSKMFLFFTRELSELISFSNRLGEGYTLIINNHVPFYIREQHKFLDNIKFEAKYLFPDEYTGDKTSMFFNIDTSWLLFLLDNLEQNNIVFLEGHTHEQYKFSFDYQDKKVRGINNNLGYGRQ